MEKYRKVKEKRPGMTIDPNEIRITAQGLVGNYINIATTLFQVRGRNEIVLKGMGQAISKTVTIAEIVKRYNRRLHQETEISSVFITDVYEPIEEGLLVVEKIRRVSMISITLSINDLDKTSPGYQAPILVERKRQYNNYQQPKRYNSVNEGSYGGRYQENRGEYGNYRGYGNYHGGGYRNYQENTNGYGNQGGFGGRGGNAVYRGGGYGRGGGGRYNGRGR